MKKILKFLFIFSLLSINVQAQNLENIETDAELIKTSSEVVLILLLAHTNEKISVEQLSQTHGIPLEHIYLCLPNLKNKNLINIENDRLGLTEEGQKKAIQFKNRSTSNVIGVNASNGAKLELTQSSDKGHIISGITLDNQAEMNIDLSKNTQIIQNEKEPQKFNPSWLILIIGMVTLLFGSDLHKRFFKNNQEKVLNEDNHETFYHQS
jgi:hypothetical protein